METLFYLESSRAGADIMAEMDIDFKYQVMYKILWDLCVSIMALDLLDGFVPLDDPEDLAKTG